MLRDFGRTLYHHSVDHRIISVTNDGRQPFGLSSMERIAYLAKTRNKALEPLQSPDPSIRVPEWQTFTKIIFMNDIVYQWRDIARLIGTKLDGREDEEYDMVCALDFEGSGEHCLGLDNHHELNTDRFLRYLGGERYLRRLVYQHLAIRQGSPISTGCPRLQAI
jgi:hypothetical protein